MILRFLVRALNSHVVDGSHRTPLLLAIAVTVAGCSNLPSAVDPPDIDASDLAESAMNAYDKNGDGVIDAQELDAAPSLRFALKRIDANKDGKIQSEEIVEFAQRHWIDRESGIIRVRCQVTMDRRPLDGATVTLEPEEFMGGAVAPASGVTRGGVTNLDVADEARPHPNAHGVQNGLYLVRISMQRDGKELIPARYNEQTTLGCEIADRAAYMPGPLKFALKSR
ncbi:MAG: EF-hand domain-containing protein [Planctomycetota bacterium]